MDCATSDCTILFGSIYRILYRQIHWILCYFVSLWIRILIFWRNKHNNKLLLSFDLYVRKEPNRTFRRILEHFASMIRLNWWIRACNIHHLLSDVVATVHRPARLSPMHCKTSQQFILKQFAGIYHLTSIFTGYCSLRLSFVSSHYRTLGSGSIFIQKAKIGLMIGLLQNNQAHAERIRLLPERLTNYTNPWWNILWVNLSFILTRKVFVCFFTRKIVESYLYIQYYLTYWQKRGRLT